jgi:NAD(P)-dependent dehydrogenase (short-subunit alcohol dehydrogenase family)
MLRHHDKVVLITGAARGIGRATAELFAAQGARLVLCDVAETVEAAQTTTANVGDLAQTERLVRDHGRPCVTCAVDVRDQSSIDTAVGAALAEFDRIDVAIANAGIMHSEPFWTVGDTAWQTIIDINLSGVWRTAKAVAPQMILQQSGVILATASVQARTARPGLAGYTASKHGVCGLMKTIALELGAYNIRANTVLPGAVHTPMIDNETAGLLTTEADGGENRRTAFFRRMAVLQQRSTLPPTAIANAFSWLASDDAAEITGVELPVDAGSLILPGYNSATAAVAR